MFNMDLMELLLVLLVAFVIVGPKDLPKVARWLARMVKKLRGFISDVKDELGLDELSKDMAETKKQVQDAMKEADISKEMQEAQSDLRAAASDLEQDMKKAAEDVQQSIDKK